MRVFRRYRRMLVRAVQVAVVCGLAVTVFFAGGVLFANPLSFLGIAAIATLISLMVALAALLGAFAAVWLGDRRIERSPARRVALSVLGAGFGVAALAVVLSLFDGQGLIDWAGASLSVGLFCAVVAATCAGFMASFVEFPAADSSDIDADAPVEDAAALRDWRVE